MKNWYTLVSQDLSNLPDFFDYYADQLEDARREVKVSGKIELSSAELPGIFELRFSQLQVIEAVLSDLEKQLRAIRTKYFRKYLEGYNRQLTSRDAEKYVDGENDVIEMESIINEVALLRNRYLSIIKALEVKQWQLGNIIKLKIAGFDDYRM